jgi:hypothetical protein
MIYTIGIDPGEVICGWALVRADLAARIEIMAHGQTGRYKRGERPATPTTGYDVRQILVGVGKLLGSSWPPTLGIEELFLPSAPHHGKQRANAVAALKGQLGAGRWIGVAEAFGCPVYEHRPGAPGVPPALWRQAEWGRSRWRREEAKEYAIRMAKTLWGLEFPASRHHVAEACFIAAYVAAKLRIQRRLERQEAKRK